MTSAANDSVKLIRPAFVTRYADLPAAPLRPPIDEMFIIFPKNYYCLPHKHPSEESLLVIKGLVDIVIFNNKGKIKHVIKMGDSSTGRIFFHKFKKNTIHLLIVRSKFLYFKEVTKGPFTTKNMSRPKWCPKNKKQEEEFYKILKYRLKKIKNNSPIILK